MLIFSNIIAPLIAGLFFLLYFVYFTITNPSRTATFKYFIAFLVAISVFTLGRPLQLLSGPHPLPLIIVNVRVFILCAVIAPVIILASDVFNRSKRKRLQFGIISACVALGLTYVVFNTLGTQSSKVLFQFAGIDAIDNDTPSGRSPFYGREVTIAVQMCIGFILLAFSGLKLVRQRPGASISALVREKTFLFNAGIVIFAVFFIVGSYFKQWGLYYAASILSALLFGASVLIDAKEIRGYYEKLVPFIKEDIIDNVALSELSPDKLSEMLRCLGKGDVNTIAIIKLKFAKTEVLHGLAFMDEIMKIVSRRLAAAFDEDCYLPLVLSNGRVCIAVKLPIGGEGQKSGVIWDALEGIKAEAEKSLQCEVAIGLGRSYPKIEDLHASYREALSAQEYAESLDGGLIIHVDNIQARDRNPSRYPFREKERLLSLIRVGDVANARLAFADFMSRFTPFISEKPEVLRVRLYELVGSLIDAAALGGGDQSKLDELIETYYKDIDHVKDAALAEKWLTGVVAQIASSVARVFEKRSKSIIRDATRFIDGNFARDISYKDVAKEVSVSPSYFLSLFKAETGLTFVDYLTEVRIRKAKQLLATTDKSVAEIAFEVGFKNSNYFSSVFRKIVGTTAKDYRVSVST